eukprot:5060538-Ditylum_brightwellii.AAC.1
MVSGVDFGRTSVGPQQLIVDFLQPCQWHLQTTSYCFPPHEAEEERSKKPTLQASWGLWRKM